MMGTSAVASSPGNLWPDSLKWAPLLGYTAMEALEYYNLYDSPFAQEGTAVGIGGAAAIFAMMASGGSSAEKVAGAAFVILGIAAVGFTIRGLADRKT